MASTLTPFNVLPARAFLRERTRRLRQSYSKDRRDVQMTCQWRRGVSVGWHIPTVRSAILFFDHDEISIWVLCGHLSVCDENLLL